MYILVCLLSGVTQLAEGLLPLQFLIINLVSPEMEIISTDFSDEKGNYDTFLHLLLKKSKSTFVILKERIFKNSFTASLAAVISTK